MTILGELRLRPLRESDEAEVAAAHQVMADADGFTFALGYEPGMPWAGYVRQQDELARSTEVSDGLVPSTFLLATAGDRIVGRSSVRHALNDFLLWEAGHIGYCVLPGYRRRGYATEILRQSLIVARAAGVDRVLVTCDDINTGSATVIETCGGELESVVAARTLPPRMVRRYWIG